MESKGAYFEQAPIPECDASSLLSVLKSICPYVLMVCFRNKNKNVVIYQANVVHGKLQNPPVLGYWLILEPSYRADRRKKGIRHDREELSRVDKTFAWGFTTQPVSPSEHEFKFTMFDSQSMKVILTKKGETYMYVTRDDKTYIIRSLFIKSSEVIKIINIRDNVETLCLHAINVTDKQKPVQIYIKGTAPASTPADQVIYVR